MKQILRYSSGISHLLLFFLIVFSTQVQANNIKGSDIYYSSTSTPNVYLVTLKAYRDCSAALLCVNCPLGLPSLCKSSIAIYGKDSIWNNLHLGTHDLNSVPNSSAFDLMQLCALDRSVCTNCGTRIPGTFMPGVEVYTFEGLVNLNGLPAGCCNVELRVFLSGKSYGSTVLSVEGTHYVNKLELNRCLVANNNSIVHHEPPGFVLCNNVYQTIDFGASDPDGDSLSFQLGSALITFGQPATYLFPFSPSVPFPYIGIPVQSPPAQAPLGIQFNKYTGALSFQPVGVFKADVIIETKEWRKINGVSRVIATNRRDYQIVSQNCQTNQIIPVKKYNEIGVQVGVMNHDNFDSINVCEGTSYCRTYVAMGDANATDTTVFKWSIPTNMPGATITRMYDSATRHLNGPRHDSIKFCWSAPIGSARNRPYILNFEGRDNACPIPVFARKSIGIFVNKQPLVTIQKQHLGQFAYKFNYSVAPGSSALNLPVTRWYIEKTPGSNVFDTLAANTINNFVFSSLGKFKIMLYADGYGLCNSNLLLDSVTIDFIDLALVMRHNISCKGESTGKIKVQTLGGTSPFQYKVNNGNWQSSNEFTNLPAGSYKVYVRDTFNRTDSLVVHLTQSATDLTSFVTTLNPSCSNGFGSAQITASGGAQPYLYKYDSTSFTSNSTFAGLLAKSYTFYAVDSFGCQKSMSASISIPSKMVVTSLVTDNKCYQSNLGSVSLSVSGATPPYTYRLGSGANQTSSVFNSLAKGTYKFYIIDSKNCKDSVSIQINEPTQLNSTMSKTDATCLGALNGAAWVQVSGGALPYNYIWRNAPTQHNSYANNLGAGLAHVTVTDSNGCVRKDSTNIAYTPPYNNDEICAISTDTSTGVHKIAWKKTLNKGIVSYKIYGSSVSGGAFGLIATVPFDSIGFYINSNPLHLNKVWYYKIRAVDSCGNVSTGSYEQSNIFLQVTGSKNLNWNSISTFIGATNIRVWRSIDNGAFQQIASFSPINLSYQDNTASGFIRRYYLEVDLMPNCLSQIGGSNLKFLSNLVTVNTTGVKETIMPNLFQIYPNPSNGKVQIGSDRNDLEIAAIELYNVQGDRVKMISCEAHTRSLSLDLTELANGVYQVVIVTPENTRHNNKLVLNR
jgi:hypothetical protein